MNSQIIIDGKGIVMLAEDLQEQTECAAEEFSKAENGVLSGELVKGVAMLYFI